MSSPSPVRPSFLDLDRPGTVRFICSTAALAVLFHLTIWRWTLWRHQSFAQLLSFWDATESLFLLLSLGAFAFSGTRGPLPGDEGAC